MRIQELPILQLSQVSNNLCIWFYCCITQHCFKEMNLDWCKQSDAGLPKPDLVFLLTLSSAALIQRPGYGAERYEQSTIQQRVAEMYKKLADDCWKIIDADGSVESVHSVLLENVLNTIDTVKNKPLQTLW